MGDQANQSQAQQKEKELKDLSMTLDGEEMKLHKLRESASRIQQAAEEARSLGVPSAAALHLPAPDCQPPLQRAVALRPL